MSAATQMPEKRTFLQFVAHGVPEVAAEGACTANAVRPGRLEPWGPLLFTLLAAAAFINVRNGMTSRARFQTGRISRARSWPSYRTGRPTA
jgi:hypothetical protein